MSDTALREHLVNLLQGRGAHVPFERAVADLPAQRCGVVPSGSATSPWQQLEHLRLAQWDILEFSRDPHHVSPEWPDGYWPTAPSPGAGAWQRSVEQFLADRAAMVELVSDARADLYRPFDHGTGQTPAARGAGAGRPQRLSPRPARAAAPAPGVLVTPRAPCRA